MKTLLTSILLAGSLTSTVFSAPTKPLTKSEASSRLSQQIGSYITYPNSLPKSPKGSIVIIQFAVSADSRLRNVAVLSPDEKLNTDLVRQLTGKKLALAETDPDKVHTLRVHFQTD